MMDQLELIGQMYWSVEGKYIHNLKKIYIYHSIVKAAIKQKRKRDERDITETGNFSKTVEKSRWKLV